MALARLALSVAAFGAASHGLILVQDTENGPAQSKGASKWRLGALGAKMQRMQAEQSVLTLTKEYTKTTKLFKANQNMSSFYRHQREKATEKAEEVVAIEDERAEMQGRHAIFNSTLAAERKKSGDRNRTGLWTITDEPETKEERGRRRAEAQLRLAVPQEYNVTRFLEVAMTNANQEKHYKLLADHYAEHAAELEGKLRTAKAAYAEADTFLSERAFSARQAQEARWAEEAEGQEGPAPAEEDLAEDQLLSAEEKAPPMAA